MTRVLKPARFRALALSVGASSFALACSFGTVDDTDAVGQGPTDLGSMGDQEMGDEEMGDQATPDIVDNSQDPGTGGSADPVANQPQTPVDAAMDDFAGMGADGEQFQTEIAQQVLGVLELNCGGCHSNGVELGGVGAILDFQSLVDSGKLVMGERENSSLYTRMKAGTMPPASSTQRPGAGDIDLVGQFIDDLQAPGGDECEPLDFMTYDEMFDIMLQDVLRQDAEDRPFTRYLTASYSSNAGDCGRDLQRQRYGLFKMINSVSLNTRITQPVAVDADELIYRIDIRDYDWDREIDLEDDGIVDFDDAWLAMIDIAAPYAVEFEGDEAEELKAQTGVAIPNIPINAWLQEVTTNDLYYALIDGRQNINDTEVDLGIDEDEQREDRTFWRAGFSTSGVSKQERAVTRQEIGTYQGNYWLSQDFADLVGQDSLYADPLDFEFNGGEAIYSLPNGLQAYYATNDEGDRVSEVPVNIVIDPAQNNGVVTNAASCHSCHNGGMIPFEDTVRKYVEANPLNFDAVTFEEVQEEYLPVDEFNRIVEEDSERHVAAVERAGVPRGTADPVSRIFLDFQLGSVDAVKAAGELNVPLDIFQENIERLDPVLSPLQNGGGVDRNFFTNVYFDSLCIMQSSSQNRPANCN